MAQKSDFRACLLLLALWLPATLFLGGRLGWWNDDYYFCGRDPGTGAISHWSQTATNPFEPRSPHMMAWRPINYALTSSSITLFWNHDWVVHLAGALVHLAGALLMLRLLREIGLSWQARVAGAAFLLLMPAHFEAYFWASAICTGLGGVMVVGGALLYTRYIRGEASRAAIVAMITVLSLVPMVNEQPAALVGAFPLLALVVAPAGTAWRGMLRRAIAPLLIVGVVYITYLEVIAHTLPPGTHGSATSFRPLREIPLRIAQVYARLLPNYTLKFSGIPALRFGWRTIVEHWSLTIGFGAGIATAAFFARRRWMESDASTLSRIPRSRVWWLAAFAFALTVLAMLPVAAILWASLRPRMIYAASVGFAILLGLGVDLVRTRALARSLVPARIASGLVGLVLALVAITVLIGVQAGYRARQDSDAASAANIRSVLPNPPSGTIFVPLGVDNIVGDLPPSDFAFYFASPWYWSFGYPTFVQHAYHRADIHSTCCDYARSPIVLADGSSFTIDGPMHPDLPKDSEGRRQFLWEHALPFEVGRDGSIALLSPITIERDGKVLGVVTPPMVEAARRNGAVEVRPFTLRPREAAHSAP